jgi:hypothetical protein
MKTRVALALLLLAATASACSSHQSASPPSANETTSSTARESDTQLATDAYVWGYPLVVTERTLQSLAALVPENHLTMQPARSGLNSRTIVAPNTDTLYAVAPLDLRGEPYVLTVPAIHDRYYSFQLISAYTDSFAYIGTRATGGRAGRWAITPPGWHGTLPAGITRLASPTPQLLVLGRFLVTDDADVARVHALGRNIALEPLSTITGAAPASSPPPIGQTAGTPQSVAAAGAAFFDQLGDALAINPPTDPQELRTLQRFAAIGIGPGRHPTVQVGEARVRAALAAGVRAGAAEIATAATKSIHTVNGWGVNLDIGTYGHDARTRAVVADVGWGANVPQEAVYAHSGHDAAGTQYRGSHRYVLHFARGELPPVNAFWSVTMYGPDHFFTANPINRYAIGDRTSGLQFGTDGSLDIYIQHDPPAGHEANWLPAPAGRFELTLRLYLPKSSVLDGRYVYPKVETAPQ